MNLAFFASHNGSNAQAIIDACTRGEIKARPTLLISNNADSKALERARQAQMHAIHLSSKTHPTPAALDTAMLTTLIEHKIDLIILAGYMKMLGPQTLSRFAGRVLNIHPALLPKFGGKGMYGMHVHNAVILAKERESGATVHIATEHYDEGPIIAQRRIELAPDETPESLAAKVLIIEHALYVDTVAAIADGRIALPIVAPPIDSQ